MEGIKVSKVNEESTYDSVLAEVRRVTDSLIEQNKFLLNRCHSLELEVVRLKALRIEGEEK